MARKRVQRTALCTASLGNGRRCSNLAKPRMRRCGIHPFRQPNSKPRVKRRDSISDIKRKMLGWDNSKVLTMMNINFDTPERGGNKKEIERSNKIAFILQEELERRGLY